jgi:hypothetical protein
VCAEARTVSRAVSVYLLSTLLQAISHITNHLLNVLIQIANKLGFKKKKISSLTIGVWRSLGITVFSTYQGASTVMRKFSIGRVLRFLCLKWKPYPRVVFRKSGLI